MMGTNRKTFLILVTLVVICILGYVLHREGNLFVENGDIPSWRPPKMKRNQLQRKTAKTNGKAHKANRIENLKFHSVLDGNLYVYSAFWDCRKGIPRVRIFAVADLLENSYKHIACYWSNSALTTMDVYNSTGMIHNIDADPGSIPNCRWKTVQINCPIKPTKTSTTVSRPKLIAVVDTDFPNVPKYWLPVEGPKENPKKPCKTKAKSTTTAIPIITSSMASVAGNEKILEVLENKHVLSNDKLVMQSSESLGYNNSASKRINTVRHDDIFKTVHRKRREATEKLQSKIQEPQHINEMGIKFDNSSNQITLVSDSEGFKDKLLPSKPMPVQNLAICAKTLYDQTDNNAFKLIESMELNKLLGVKKIIMYGYNNVTTNIVKILNHYVQKGFLKLMPWNLPFRSIQTESVNQPWLRNDPVMIKARRSSGSGGECVAKWAMRLAHQECLYRHMYQYQYIAFIDRDEFIVPTAKVSTPKMLRRVPRKASSVFFNERLILLGRKVQHNESLVLTHFSVPSTSHIYRSDQRGKTIVKPKTVFHMEVHKTVGGYTYRAPRKLGQMYHYRRGVKVYRNGKAYEVIRSATLNRYRVKNSTEDRRMLRYEKSLKKNIASVLGKLGIR